MITGVMSRIEDLNTVLSQTQEHRYRVLVAAAKNVRNWFIKVRKIKAIYYILNICNLDVTTKCLIAECWVPSSDFDRVCQAVQNGCARSGSTIPPVISPMTTKETPPTYHRTNKVTRGFQNIVDSYGVATYREINPAPFTMITFPFLFAVMFGDAGHGLLMALFAAWMVLKERNLQLQKNQNEIWLMFFNGRYMILLMGLFSIYTGLMYNDIFSKSINIFGSSWMSPKLNSTILMNPFIMLNPQYNYRGNPYLFGVDPVWQLAANKILFLNSYKMKLSVILGVAQMFFGVMLSYFNHRFFAKQLNVLCEFIPQVIFLLSIFGYMNLLIFIKWMKYDWTSSAVAPSILINMINMFLMKYPDDGPVYLRPWYGGQKFFQTILLLSALICVPWMLIIKPYLLKKQNDLKMRFHNDSDHILQNSNDAVLNIENGPKSMSHSSKHEDKFELGEIIVHQAIHTIEYCLGSISHTASYLRLWALSLAHAQLSEVLWTMVFRIGLQGEGISGGFVMFVVFAFWATLTVSVLLVMEGLSAFLHALRLHW